MTTGLLQAEALGLQRHGVALLADVSLELQSGRVAVVIGPNGAGKSTLLKVLSGEMTAERGRVTLGGEPIGALPLWRLACLRAVLPQTSLLTLPFTVREIVRLGGDRIGRRRTRSDLDALTEAALSQADLCHLANRTVQTLSGGEQQRVHFARILCQLAAGRSLEPRQVLLLDEPIASLDLRHGIALLEGLRDLAATGVAVLVILHDLNLAAAYADDLIVMDRSRIVAQGLPQAVLTDAILRDTFGLQMRIRAVPAPPVPFVLPEPRR